MPELTKVKQPKSENSEVEAHTALPKEAAAAIVTNCSRIFTYFSEKLERLRQEMEIARPAIEARKAAKPEEAVVAAAEAEEAAPTPTAETMTNNSIDMSRSE